MQTKLGSVILGAGAGRVLQAIGNTVTIKVGTKETGGASAVIDYVAAPGFPGPPPHLHNAMDESFYVLEGRIRFHVDGKDVDAEPGGFVYIPRGTRHTFSNPHGEPAHFLSLVTPGGFERYFEELVEAINTGGWPPSHERMAELGRKYDIVPTDGAGN